MPSHVTTEWNGDAIVRKMERAARYGVNETVDAARDDAEVTHPFVNRDVIVKKDGRKFFVKAGHLEAQIVSEHASVGERNPTASFGTSRKDGFYGLFHEIGTIREIARPFLRPAGDRQFPTLKERIARRFFG